MVSFDWPKWQHLNDIQTLIYAVISSCIFIAHMFLLSSLCIILQMEDIFLPFKKGGMNDIDLGEPSSSQPETSSQEQAESSSMDIDSTSTQVRQLLYILHCSHCPVLHAVLLHFLQSYKGNVLW